MADPDYCPHCCDNPDHCDCGAVEHPEETVEIQVNGSKFSIAKEHVSYEDIALLAGKPEAKDLTVVYTRPPSNGEGISGTLIPGRSIDVEDRMTFDAVRTNTA